MKREMATHLPLLPNGCERLPHLPDQAEWSDSSPLDLVDNLGQSGVYGAA